MDSCLSKERLRVKAVDYTASINVTIPVRSAFPASGGFRRQGLTIAFPCEIDTVCENALTRPRPAEHIIFCKSYWGSRFWTKCAVHHQSLHQFLVPHSSLV